MRRLFVIHRLPSAIFWRTWYESAKFLWVKCVEPVGSLWGPVVQLGGVSHTPSRAIEHSAQTPSLVHYLYSGFALFVHRALAQFSSVIWLLSSVSTWLTITTTTYIYNYLYYLDRRVFWNNPAIRTSNAELFKCNTERVFSL